MEICEVKCKQAIGKCGFPGGGWAINPYVGCGHGCVYCYARFIKRFTGHNEPWGTFIDARVNIAEVLKKQIKNCKYHQSQIFLSTITDPYQPVERKYQLTKKVLEVLKEFPVSVSIMTKSALALRDIALLKKFKNLDVNFTINSLDEEWQGCTEPNSSSVTERLAAVKKLTSEGISVFAMMGPYWPFFTDPEALFLKFKEVGIKRVFTESFNTVGGNWTGVEAVLKKNYPKLLPDMKKTLFNKNNFYEFYSQEETKVKKLAEKYHFPTTIYFGLGHAGKFK